jgi:hypothetical protein
MVFRAVLFVWEFLIDVLAVSRLSDDEKALELLLLRQHLRIVEPKQARGPKIPRWQKIPLAVLAVRLKEQARSGRAALDVRFQDLVDNKVGWNKGGSTGAGEPG